MKRFKDFLTEASSQTAIDRFTNSFGGRMKTTAQDGSWNSRLFKLNPPVTKETVLTTSKSNNKKVVAALRNAGFRAHPIDKVEHPDSSWYGLGSYVLVKTGAETEVVFLTPGMNESMGVNMDCDTPEEAQTQADSLGLTGVHEINGKYYPGKDPEELQNWKMTTYRKKDVISGNDP